MPARVIPIVEGHGEVAAVPLLLRRIANTLGIHDAYIGKPIRCSRHKLLKSGELERAIELAALKSGRDGRVLLLIDADTDCPAELAPSLLARAQQARQDIRMGVVLAKHEFEAWFLGSLESLREEYPIAPGQAPPRPPEEIRGAKEHLGALLGIAYSPSVDQPAMAERFDMGSARNACPSFDKLWRTVESLLAS